MCFFHAFMQMLSTLFLICIQNPSRESKKSCRIPTKQVETKKATPNYPVIFHNVLASPSAPLEKLSAQEMRQLFGVSSRSQIDPWG